MRKLPIKKPFPRAIGLFVMLPEQEIQIGITLLQQES